MIAALAIIAIDLAAVIILLAIVSRLGRRTDRDAPRQVADNQRAVEFGEYFPLFHSIGDSSGRS